MVDEIREEKYSQSIDFLDEQHRHQNVQSNLLEKHNTISQEQPLTMPHPVPHYLSTETFDFEFDTGRETIHSHMMTLVPQYFMGYCYYCDCPQHSQNFCPLRFCYFCEDYGHSSRVCLKKQHSMYQHQYYSHFSHPSNFSKHWKKPRRMLKIPFGSTWKDDTGGVFKSESWRKKERPVAQILFDFDNK